MDYEQMALEILQKATRRTTWLKTWDLDLLTQNFWIPCR